MSDEFETLGDASWAAGLLVEQDWLDLQSTGSAITEGREFFYLGVCWPVQGTKDLLEAYAAINTNLGTEEQAATLSDFMYQVMSGFYDMAVEARVVDKDFWKTPE
jgi:hypothetical protein